MRLPYRKNAAIREAPETMLAGSLKRPQREGLPSFKVGILVINKIKKTVTARTDDGLFLPKSRVE
jgi:hypothetical protein